MKHFYTLLFLLISLTVSHQSVAQGSLAALDAKNGFKDAKFGMPLSAFKGMILANSASNNKYHKYYRRSSDNNLIGYTHLIYTEYHFYKEILVEVIFAVMGKTECDNTLQAIQETYGPGNKWPTNMGIGWKGKHVYLNLLYIQDENNRPYYRFNMGDENYIFDDIRKEQVKLMSKDL